MAFKLEKNMTIAISQNYEKLIKLIDSSNKIKKFYIGKEIPFSYRIVDLVIVTYEEDIIIDLEKFKDISFLETDILSLIYCNKKVSIDRISKIVGIEKNVLENILTKMIEKEYIYKVSRKSYSFNNKYKHIVAKKFVSFELKLSNWKEALDQGIFNKKFSDESYVVLDKDRIPKNIDLKPIFKENNIGLITLDENIDIKLIVKPKKNKNLHKYSNTLQKIRFIKDIFNKKKWENYK